MRKKYYCSAEYRTLLRSTHNKKCGVKERPLKIISEAAAKVAENYFWSKRGFSTPPNGEWKGF